MLFRSRGSDKIVHGVSEWYVFRGYFEKYVEGTALIQVTNVVNGKTEDPVVLPVIAQKDDKMVLEYTYHIPPACTNSKTFDLKVEDNGWTDKTKQLKATYTCPEEEHAEVQIEEPEKTNSKVELQVEPQVIVEPIKIEEHEIVPENLHQEEAEEAEEEHLEVDHSQELNAPVIPQKLEGEEVEVNEEHHRRILL